MYAVVLVPFTAHVFGVCLASLLKLLGRQHKRDEMLYFWIITLLPDLAQNLGRDFPFASVRFRPKLNPKSHKGFRYLVATVDVLTAVATSQVCAPLGLLFIGSAQPLGVRHIKEHPPPLQLIKRLVYFPVEF